MDLALACVIAFGPNKLLFNPCPKPEVIPRMECVSMMADGPMANTMYVVCVDPTTKEIVYADKAYLVQEA